MTSSNNSIKVQGSTEDKEVLRDGPQTEADAPSNDRPEFEDEPEVDEEQQLRKHLEEDPDDIECCQRLATLLRQRDQNLQAFKVLDQGAMACVEHGRISHAIELMERVLSLWPECTQAHMKIGKIYLQEGQYREAAESIGKAFDGYLDQGDFDKCAQALEVIEQIEPEGIICTIKRAELTAQKGDIDQALALFRKGAEALENDGQRQDFLEVGERMLELDPTLGDIRAKVGETLIAEAHAFVNYGLFDKAVKALARAIRYDPNQVETYLTLARVLVQGGRRDDAVDMAILATHKVEGDAQKRELLDLIWELTGDHKQVENLAEEMDINLGEDASQGWPFPDEVPQELGNEETSPVHCTGDFSPDVQEATRENGPLIGGSSVVNNLVSLLSLSARATKTRCLTLCEQGENRAVAEIIVSRGRICLGVRLQGEFYVGEEFEQRPPNLVEKLETLATIAWQILEDGSGDRSDETPVLAATDKNFFGKVTARALVEIAEYATQTPLGTYFVQPVDEHPSSMLSFSPASLLMAAADSMVGPCDTKNAPMEEMKGFSEELWLMVRPDKGEDFLPLEHNRVNTGRLDEALAISDVASQLAEQVETFRGVDSSISDFVGISFIFCDGAWSALVGEEIVVLARSSSNSIGSLLRRLRAETDGGNR